MATSIALADVLRIVIIDVAGITCPRMEGSATNEIYLAEVTAGDFCLCRSICCRVLQGIERQYLAFNWNILSME
jgi:hypothetical protein